MRFQHMGDRIRDLRQENGKTQKELAIKFYVQPSTWSQYENFKRCPDIDRIKRIAEYFDVSIDYLMGITDEIYDIKDKQLIEVIKQYTSINENEKKEFIKYIKKFNGGK